MAAAAVLTPAVALARENSEVHYHFDQVWGATVRLVRVDYGFAIRDHDENTGYLLFDYKDNDRTYPGSFQFVRTDDDGAPVIKIELSIPAMPSYIERMMLDKLERKLENDYGDPPPPPPPPPKKKPSNDKPDKKPVNNGDDGDG